MKKILLVGPLPPPIGGISASFKASLEALNNIDGAKVSFVNTSSLRNSFFAILRLISCLIISVRGQDVVFISLTTKRIYSFGLVVLLICRLYGVKFVLRKGGGTSLSSQGKIRRLIANYVLRNAELYYLQTQRLYESAKYLGHDNVKWLPTLRSPPVVDQNDVTRPKVDSSEGLKVIFLGQVKKDKGIQLLIDIDDKLPVGIRIDVYGPLLWEYNEEDFFGLNKVYYRGVVLSDNVDEVMGAYDVLVLPTFHEGEGYPGVLIEAMFNGLAIITTEWKDIPEILDDRSAILIPPNNGDELLLSLFKLTSDKNYLTDLKNASLKESVKYDVNLWAKEFFDAV